MEKFKIFEIKNQEMSKIQNPLDDLYKDKSDSIHTNMASIEPLQIRYNENINL